MKKKGLFWKIIGLVALIAIGIAGGIGGSLEDYQ